MTPHETHYKFKTPEGFVNVEAGSKGPAMGDACVRKDLAHYPGFLPSPDGDRSFLPESAPCRGRPVGTRHPGVVFVSSNSWSMDGPQARGRSEARKGSA